MNYQLPDETTLAKYLCMLQRVFVLARFRAYETDPQLARLFDAVENVPDLLMRWPDMEDIVVGQLEHLEGQYPEWSAAFTSILRSGAPERWQQRWR